MSTTFIKNFNPLYFLKSIDHIKHEHTTYFNHMQRALGMSINLLLGSIALGIHAIFPNKFRYTGSSIIIKEYEKIQQKIEGKILSKKHELK